MKNNILLLLGHPSENSFCKGILDAYQKGAESAGASCKTIYISQLKFDDILSTHGRGLDRFTAIDPMG
jgi:NAD(P)H dehydrogenase (quinone)